MSVQFRYHLIVLPATVLCCCACRSVPEPVTKALTLNEAEQLVIKYFTDQEMDFHKRKLRAFGKRDEDERAWYFLVGPIPGKGWESDNFYFIVYDTGVVKKL